MRLRLRCADRYFHLLLGEAAPKRKGFIGDLFAALRKDKTLVQVSRFLSGLPKRGVVRQSDSAIFICRRFLSPTLNEHGGHLAISPTLATLAQPDTGPS